MAIFKKKSKKTFSISRSNDTGFLPILTPKRKAARTITRLKEGVGKIGGQVSDATKQAAKTINARRKSKPKVGKSSKSKHVPTQIKQGAISIGGQVSDATKQAAKTINARRKSKPKVGKSSKSKHVPTQIKQGAISIGGQVSDATKQAAKTINARRKSKPKVGKSSKSKHVPTQIKQGAISIGGQVSDATKQAAKTINARRKSKPKVGKSSKSKHVPTQIKQGAISIGGQVSDATKQAAKTINARRKSKPKARRSARNASVAEKVSTTFNQVLSTDVSKSVDGWFRDAFTQGSSTFYDKAMDSARQLSGEFGGNHRLFDGGHTLTGAWEKVTNALPNDSLLDETKGYLTSLAKDGFTPAGLPFATLNRDSVTNFIENTGISREWVEDAVTVTGTELIGSATSGVAAFLKWNDNDISSFTQMVAGMGVYSISSSNPLLAITAISSLAYAWQKGDMNKEDMLRDVAKGVVAPTVFVTVAGAVPGPAALGLIAAAATAYAAKKAVEQKEFREPVKEVATRASEKINSTRERIFSTFEEARECTKSNRGSVQKPHGNNVWVVSLKR